MVLWLFGFVQPPNGGLDSERTNLGGQSARNGYYPRFDQPTTTTPRRCSIPRRQVYFGGRKGGSLRALSGRQVLFALLPLYIGDGERFSGRGDTTLGTALAKSLAIARLRIVRLQSVRAFGVAYL